MKAAVTVEPGRLEIRQLSPPRPGPGEVLLATQVVGICGSDVHLFHGDHPYSRFPSIQGHEFSAIVVESHPGTAGGPPPGSLVAVEPLRPCRACLACRRGHPNCCRDLAVLGAHVDGALAEQLVVPAASCYVADDMPADLAALAEPVSIGLQAVNRAGLAAEDYAVILGAGPIGQAATLAAADRGARVMAVDRLRNRLIIAAALGAEVSVNSLDMDVESAIRDWAGPDGPVAVIDATGVPELIQLGTRVVAHSGTVVIVGISVQEVSLSVADFTRKELNVIGSRNNAGVFGQALDLVRRHREQVTEVVSHHYSFPAVADAMVLATEHPDLANKILITVGAAA